MPRSTRLSLAFAMILVAGADAGEEAMHDLRMVVELRPADFAYDWSIYGSSRQGDDAADRAVACGVGARWGWGRAGSSVQGFAGGEILAVEESYGSGGRQGWIGRLEAGTAWSATTQLTLTAGVCAGGGLSSFTMPGGAIGGQTLSGPTVEYGLRAGLRLRVGASWSVGLEGGWLASQERYRDGDATLAVDRSGGWLGLAIGYVFGDRPRAID